ncbi:MAG: B12-binding domain-containing radical SAM protein [Deltaproteobacteria bacterium]|nr:B12-binding domain-containing radical SAM protein [Deltaproteobacteria bacterium]MBW2330432.1 B12-binding domain-containing radical SAM protein [Deltaproteobacteria bacterium]
MNLLLIHPSKHVLGKRDTLYARESLTPSLGLAYIAAYCRNNGINVKIIDLRLSNKSMRDILDYVKQTRPIVGITAFTNEITSAGRIAEIIKETYPEIWTVVGGPHSTLIPVETLKEFPGFDAAILGEGEETLVELLRHLDSGKRDLDRIKGLAYHKGKDVILNEKRKALDDLNALPFPAWDSFELEHYTGPFMISSSRGCPYPCYFCTPSYLGKTRVRDPVNVVDELEHDVRQFGAKSFQFADATLSLLEEKAFTLCDEIIKRNLHRSIRWDCETRADKLCFDMLRKMKEAGCNWIALGVETGSERILRDVIKKGETKEDIKNAVKLIRKAGLKVRCFFILGHYTETMETIRESINFALELNPDALSFGLMVPNPGSKLRALAEKGKGGLKILHNRWEDYNQFNYSCFESDSLSLDELKKWQSRAYLTFYSHHPLKGIDLFLDSSGYNYNLKAFVKVPFMLLGNLLKKGSSQSIPSGRYFE